MRLFTLALVVLTTGALAFALSAWADGGSPAAVAPVSIHDFSYDPATITVDVGDTVTWTNDQAGVDRTVTARNGSFDQLVPPGQSFSYTFTKTGTFSYFCDIHPFMHGQVKVRSSAG